MKKRFLCWTLSLAMLMSLMPATAFAEEVEQMSAAETYADEAEIMETEAVAETENVTVPEAEAVIATETVAEVVEEVVSAESPEMIESSDGDTVGLDAATALTGTALSCASSHNYANSEDSSYTVGYPGNSEIKGLYITFHESTELEDNYDFLYIYDENDTQIGKYTGTELAGNTISVAGSSARIRLVSDNSVSRWGFEAIVRVSDTVPNVAEGNCGENLSWELHSDGELTISGTGAMYEFPNGDDAPWYNYHISIKSVIIGDGVTSVGSHAFFSCNSLKTITIPNKVTRIGKGAFRYCANLSTVILGTGVTEIDNDAFCECKSLETITIPDKVTRIGKSAFCDCDNLSTVILGTGVTEIDVAAFSECGNLSAVTLGTGVTEIKAYAFDACDSLAEITVPASVEMIDNDAFGSNTKLVIEGSKAALDYAKANGNDYTCKHRVSNYTYNNDATSTKDGTESGTCSVCDEKVTRTAAGTKISLATPSITKAVNTTSGVQITFKASAGAAKYRIFYRKAGGSWTKAGDTTATSYTVPKSKLVSGTKYYFTARCMDKDGKYVSDYVKTFYYVYLAPVKVDVENGCDSDICLNWTYVESATGYCVYRKEAGGSYKKLKTIKTNSQCYYDDTDKNLVNGKAYSYCVRAYKTVGGVNYYGAYYAKSIYCLTPVNFYSVTNSGAGKMTLKWKANTKATGYQIQYSLNDDFDPKTTVYAAATTTSKTISSLKVGKYYYVRIRAYKTNSAGTKYYSGFDDVWKVKIAR